MRTLTRMTTTAGLGLALLLGTTGIATAQDQGDGVDTLVEYSVLWTL